MVKLTRWCLLTVFVASLATAVLVRGNGYTAVAAEGGKYFVTYRSTRYEVDRQEFEQSRWRNRVNGVAVATMMISLFAFIGFESIRFGGGRHVTSRCCEPGPHVHLLKVQTAPERGPGN
jgi:hypothetical protein